MARRRPSAKDARRAFCGLRASRSWHWCSLLFASEYSNLIDRYFIFRPDEDLSADPGAMGLEFEDVRFTAADGVMLHGWFVPGSNGATLVLLHGNAGNISGRLRRLAELHRRLGMNVLIFDYRGYG